MQLMESVSCVLTFAVIILFSAVLGRKLYFSALCLWNAIRGSRIPLTKYNYLRWEMPDNDIENQIRDEIRVNILFIAGILIWFASILLHSLNLLPLYLLYFPMAFGIESSPIRKRYEDFRAFFSTKLRREDFSDHLVFYGSRIEGTLTKLTESRVLAVLFVAVGILRRIW